MHEEGTLSIVQQGYAYQVRYATNNPYGQERLPWACPGEAHLTAFLHAVGTETAVLPQVCATMRQGKMVVLLVTVSAAQLATFFPPTPQVHPRTPGTSPDGAMPPDAAGLLYDSRCLLARVQTHLHTARRRIARTRHEFGVSACSSPALLAGNTRPTVAPGTRAGVPSPHAEPAVSPPPRGQGLWRHAREVQRASAHRREEFALLLEEAALLLEEAALLGDASHQLLEATAPRAAGPRREATPRRQCAALPPPADPRLARASARGRPDHHPAS
jgi:hypothetical protein